ncbi:granzyme M isoform X1 [Oryx dammah]|uniref:granzyme M isoform X1 n=1 Tax=Oryx dammah TaxID=59534 RepID=UPI001A9AC977|nr:granzyme M isoform X1 [Oryx dammah]
MERRQPSGMARQETGVRREQGRLPGGGREKTRLGRGMTAERSWVRGCRTVSAPGPEPGRAGAHTQALPLPAHPAAPPQSDPATPRMQQLRLVLGLHVLGDPSLTCRIRKVVLHPEYKPAPHLENDLALLKLDGKVKPSKTIQPLALPRRRQAVATGTWCSLAGWGLTHQPGNPARALQELDLRVLDTRMCNNSRFWHGDISSHMICLAADSKSQAPCKGDSGGPVVCRRGQVAGILSFSSKNCTNIFKPPVAVAVAPYMPWIKNTLRHNSSPPSP